MFSFRLFSSKFTVHRYQVPPLSAFFTPLGATGCLSHRAEKFPLCPRTQMQDQELSSPIPSSYNSSNFKLLPLFSSFTSQQRYQSLPFPPVQAFPFPSSIYPKTGSPTAGIRYVFFIAHSALEVYSQSPSKTVLSPQIGSYGELQYLINVPESQENKVKPL